MSNVYDLVIVGTGTAAMVAAMRVRAAGWSVAVVDFRPFGGTCALRGCDPKKMLVTGAETVDLALRMRGNGIAGDTRIDWPELMAFKHRYTDPIPASTEDYLKENGIETLHGRAHFTAPHAMQINGETIEAKHFLLAAGAEPVKLGIPGEEHLVTSEEFLNLERMPRRLVLVGGGYIAAEFSHITARTGSSVTVLQRGERMLPHFDPDLVDLLMEKFRAAGIDVRLKTTVEAVEKRRDGVFSVRASSRGETVRFEADLVVHAAGRGPDLEALNLGAANVALKDGKLALND